MRAERQGRRRLPGAEFEGKLAGVALPPPPPKGPRSTNPPPKALPSRDPETQPRVITSARDSAPLPRFHTDESAPVPNVERLLAEQRAKQAPLPSFSLDPSQPLVLEPDGFDTAPTHLRDSPHIARDAFSEAAPTRLRDKKSSVMPGPRSVLDDAALDDVVEELREATGGPPAASELSTSSLIDADSSFEPANNTMEVNVTDLVVDRPVQTRDLWNVREAKPRAPMHTVRVERPRQRRFGVSALLGMLLGAGIALGVLAFFYIRGKGGLDTVVRPPATTARATPVTTPSALVEDGIVVGSGGTQGKLKLPASVVGQHVTYDDEVLDGKTELVVSCGVHTLKVGDGVAKEVDVPCGGELVVP
ncbi:hypothetical protein BH09MYX1_BH09MYX1_47880 [soil metagenome]